MQQPQTSLQRLRNRTVVRFILPMQVCPKCADVVSKMFNRCAKRYSKLSEKAVQNGGLCSVTTGIGKRLPQIPQLRGSKVVSRDCGTDGCPVYSTTAGLSKMCRCGVQNGGLCSTVL